MSRTTGGTLPRPENTVSPYQYDCPHLDSGLLDWHARRTNTLFKPLNLAASTWGGAVPANGNDVTLPTGLRVLISSCSIPASTVFRTITIPFGSALIIGDADVTLQAHGMKVYGQFMVGSPTCRLRNKVTITIHGSRGAQALPAPEWVKGKKF
jgi:hypothetical protein